MKINNRDVCRKVAARWQALGLAVFATAVVASMLQAQVPGPNVYRVEEDWALVVGTPDPTNNGPQVTCTISPATMQTAYCAFDINYHTQPDYSAGGLQLHTWDPSHPIGIANSNQTGIMHTPGETVTWTQTMTLTSGLVTYRVLNGQSVTWDTTFGAPNGPLMVTEITSLSNLNSYDSNISLTNSGVSFSGNNVVSLTLKAVRWYDVNGVLIKQVTTPQAAFPKS